MFLDAVFQQFRVLFFPGLDLVDAAARIFVQRNVVALDELGIFAFNVKDIVLRVVFTGFRAIVAEMIDIVQAYLIREIRIRHLIRHPGFDLRIKVCAVFVPDLQKPGHMVDAGNQLLALRKPVLHPQLLQKTLRTDLYAVAEPHGLNGSVTEHIAGQHGHGIGVV